jgi:hypothetical protein
MTQNNWHVKFDSEEIRKTLNLLHQAGDVVELRILNTKKGTVSGYFDDFQALYRVTEQETVRSHPYISHSTQSQKPCRHVLATM